MKVLLFNNFKIRKKFILVYFIFIGMIFTLKSLGLFTQEFSFFSKKAFCVLFMVLLLIHYILYIISSEGMIIDESKPYLLSLGVERKDIVNEKFLKILIVFIIDTLLVAYLMKNIKIENMEFKPGFFIVLFVMAYYLMAIPIYLHFGQTSGVGTMFTASPAFIPLADKLGKNPAGLFVGIIKSTSSYTLGLILISFILIIYIISRFVGERKDF